MKRAFTLLELLIGIALISIVGGIVGIRMYKAVERKKFHTELEQLKTRIQTAHRLAISMQADWKGSLKKGEKGWIFETTCEEIEGKRLSSLQFEPLEIFFNGKRVGQLTFDFFSNGHSSPDGTLLFKSGSEEEEWKIKELFSREEGIKLGPLHPTE